MIGGQQADVQKWLIYPPFVEDQQCGGTDGDREHPPERRLGQGEEKPQQRDKRQGEEGYPEDIDASRQRADRRGPGSLRHCCFPV